MAGVGLKRAYLTGIRTRVNWDNPLTSKLLFCMVGDRFPCVDLVAGRQFTAYASGGSLNVPTVMGKGINTTGSNMGCFHTLGSADPVRTQFPLSIGYAGSQMTAINDYAHIAGVEYHNTNTNPGAAWFLHDNVGSANFGFATNQGSGSTFISQAGSVAVPNTFSNKRVLVGVRTSTRLDLWINGFLEGSRNDLSGAAIFYDTSPLLKIGSAYSLANGLSMVVCAGWGRELNPSEIHSFTLNPLQLVS